MPILKHRLELEGISHVVSLVSFLDVKAENNFTKQNSSTPNDSSLVSNLKVYSRLCIRV